MKTTLKIQVHHSPGALVRIIGLAERRGYIPIQLSVETHHAVIEVLMTVQSQRPVEILVAHVTKIFGVITVEVHHESKIRVA